MREWHDWFEVGPSLSISLVPFYRGTGLLSQGGLKGDEKGHGLARTRGLIDRTTNSSISILHFLLARTAKAQERPLELPHL